MKKKLLSLLALLLMAVTGVWAQTDLETPLTLEAKTAGTIKIYYPKEGMQYTLNGGDKTTIVPNGDDEWVLDVAIGDKVAFYGKGTGIWSYEVTVIAGGTAECYVYGNVMSLVDENGFTTATDLMGSYNTFASLFEDNANLYSHPSKELVLPATSLVSGCYSYMFSGCSSLETAPALPATELADNCYRYMFSGCENLTAAPALPATTLAYGCYEGMFNGCENLTAAPALPATTLAENCYRMMFESCINLETAPPVLPAATLASGCYYYMFHLCSSLETAPVLPATELEGECYAGMFSGCGNLNSVTCLATDNLEGNTNEWLLDVAATGTFIKAAGMEDWSRDENGIPSSWTTLDYVKLTDGGAITALDAYVGEEIWVNYTRSFTAGKASTVCLPFAYTKKTGDGSFYAFTGIEKVGDEYIATMTEPSTTTLTANTPYLYMPSATGDADFSGTYAIPASLTAGTTTSGDWKFVGTYTEQKWTEAPKGTYGFSAQDANDGITQGQFVKVGAYVRIKPMRAYLTYKNGTEDYAGAPMLTPRRAAEELPETITVRLVSASGEVTAIGTLHTRTGEVTTDGWYTLDGKHLSTQPTQKGIYVNNGKKIVIK